MRLSIKTAKPNVVSVTTMFGSLSNGGEDVTDDMRLKLCLQNYHYKNFDEFFGVPIEEVIQNRKSRIVAVSQNNIIEEYFSTHPGLDVHIEGRIELVD